MGTMPFLKVLRCLLVDTDVSSLIVKQCAQSIGASTDSAAFVRVDVAGSAPESRVFCYSLDARV